MKTINEWTREWQKSQLTITDLINEVQKDASQSDLASVVSKIQDPLTKREQFALEIAKQSLVDVGYVADVDKAVQEHAGYVVKYVDAILNKLKEEQQ